LSSVSSAFEPNTGGFELLDAVWGTSSVFTHVTVVPAVTVSSSGTKVKLSIDTLATPLASVGAVAGDRIDAVLLD
jgi:hypothetical protein